MSTFNDRIIFDVKYTANRRAEIVRNVMFNGLKLRESDGRKILSVQSFEDRKHFSIEVNAVEWIRIKGKILKLRSPREQSRVREAELKFLLQGKREGLNDPSLRSYETDEIVKFSQKRRGLFGWMVTTVGLLIFSLPGLAGLGILGMIGYIIVKMINTVH